MDDRVDNNIDRIVNNQEAATFGLPNGESLGDAGKSQGGTNGDDERDTSRDV
jgi:hypothetical protein